MITDDIKKQHLIERKKEECRRQLEFHQKNVILQSVVSLLLLTAGFHFAKKQDPILPFVIVPSAFTSGRKLENSEINRKRCKNMLKKLEKE